MLNKKIKILIGISLYFIVSCTTYKPFYSKSQKNWESANNPDSLTLDYSIFLLGDAGNPDKNIQEPTFKLMKSKMFSIDTIISKSRKDTTIFKTSNPKDIAIFLGDNIYEFGLPEPNALDRKEKERRITEQMNIVKDFKGRKIFLPGNHDWNKSKPKGLETLRRQEAFVENYLDSTDVFLPSNGCGGPVEIQTNKNLVVIVIDSEWWLHKYDKATTADEGCNSYNRISLLQQVRDIVIRNRGKNIVFAEHHPLFSNGTHGGYFTLSDYIFPLTLVRDNLYIPLPIIGSIYPLLRQYGLSRQDISNKDYQQLKQGLLSILAEEKNVVFVSGHEHALQLTRYKELNHVISGAGSKRSALFKGNNALFGHGTKGFARLNYYKNGQCWVEFWEPVEDGSKGKLIFRSPLYAIPPSTKTQVTEEKLINYKDSTKTLAAGREYKASKFKRKIFGEHYRGEWATPVKVPYLDLSTFAGGLTPLQLGGGKQTTSLRLKGKDGYEYQFRTIDKDPSALLPEGFVKTFADDLVQDQISSANPYGSLVVPGLAKAIGVYHTNPQLVYMPYSTILGPYIQEVGGKMGIIEIRPDENLSRLKEFGYTKNAIGTEKLYEKLKEDNDNEVDQKSFLRARLLDFMIGDWDRHEDQWRWAEFKKDKGAIYKPIPRDRDQVFTKFDGFLPGFAKNLIADIQSFENDIKHPDDFSIAARNLDRNFLNELDEKTWLQIAGETQRSLTDDVIEKAIKLFPPEVYNISGKEIITKLKARRNNLSKTAIVYYKILCKEVTISGSDKYELLNIDRKQDSTLVKIYKTKKDKEIDTLIYVRNFSNADTKFINLYLLAEADSVNLSGSSNKNINIRIVGGEGKDKFNLSSKSSSVTVFDSFKDRKNINENAFGRKVFSDKEWVNDYQINNFKYDKFSISPNGNIIGTLDGLMVGLSISYKKHGFRKEPYSSEQKVGGLIALKSKAIILNYTGTFYSFFAHKYDLILDGDFHSPQYNHNFYGIGNTTLNNNENPYYAVRSRELSFNTYFQRRYSDNFKVGIGPGVSYYDILNRPESDIFDSAIGQNAFPLANPATFFNVKSYLRLNFTDSKIQPKTGFKWDNEINYFRELKGDKQNYTNLRSVFSFYATPNTLLPVTFAIRLGVLHNIGESKFYQLNTIGNNNYLRGFRRDRFTGKTAYFANTEARIPVTSFRNYLLTGDFGVFGFYDTGKVSSPGTEKGKWKQSFGPGIWINLYNQLMLSTGYGISNEGRLISVNTSLRF